MKAGTTTAGSGPVTGEQAIRQGSTQPVRPRRRRRYRPRAMREAPPLDETFVPPAARNRYALLLNPFYPKDQNASFGKHVLTPSLALTSIAGSTPPGWQVRYWDENLLQGPPPGDPFPVIVGITVHLTFARRAYALARWYRERGATVVLGGLHAMSCPDEVAPHADAVAIGEGVQLWPRILADFESGSLKRRYKGSYRGNYADEPSPRREILPRRGFLTSTSLIATRGCHNRCGFCYLSTKELHMPYQTRRVQQLVDEFVANGERYGVFIDNNLGSRQEFLRELCRGLRPLDCIWSAAVTVDVSDDPSLVRDMALSGCTGVFVGLESLTGENLDDARKKTPRPDDYARRVEIFHRNGIAVNTSFVFGFDHDRPGVFEKTASWVQENRIECATFHILTPYPGTPLFRQLEAGGRILHRDWALYDTAHAVFQPRHMSPQDLEDGYAWCYETVFRFGAVWRRRPKFRGQVLPYLAGSLLYKHGNHLWPFLIRHQLTHAVWRPMIAMACRRHLRFRRQLASADESASPSPVPLVNGPLWERIV